MKQPLKLTTRQGERIIVHAKVSIYDDAVLRIGSTNLNNRSFGFDTECDIAAEPVDEAGRDAIRRFRQRTIGHWIGVSGDAHPGEDISFAYGTINGNGLKFWSSFWAYRDSMRKLGNRPAKSLASGNWGHCNASVTTPIA